MKPADYIDFKDMRKNFKKKKLLQPMGPEEFIDRLETYFDKYDKFNLYSLSLHFGMSKVRFTNHYLKSTDKILSTLASQAVNAISSHALDNCDDYKQSLRYIMANQNTGKDFIELSDEVKNDNSSIIILPAKS